MPFQGSGGFCTSEEYDTKVKAPLEAKGFKVSGWIGNDGTIAWDASRWVDQCPNSSSTCLDCEHSGKKCPVFEL